MTSFSQDRTIFRCKIAYVLPTTKRKVMPIFDYLCPTCNTKEEKIVKNSEVQVICSACDTPMSKMLCAPTFNLKGDGFFSSGTYSKAKEQGPHISNELKEMPDIELNRSLGLPDDHS